MRVWSLLVTVFGDLAPDHPLDGPALSTLMDGIGIRPEATRVALHRLRSDGWITSQKQGRISWYSLTSKGRTDSACARSRIYAHPEETGGDAKFVLLPDAETTLDPVDFIALTPRLFVCAQDTPAPEQAMILSAPHIPEWIGALIEPETLRRGYDALHDVLLQVKAECADPDTLTPRDTAVLRVMIVHTWRRLCLKHPILPPAMHSPDWRGHDCRALVAQLLDRHPRPMAKQLNTR